MLKRSGNSAAWVAEATANFTLTSTIQNSVNVANDLNLTEASSVQEAIDGLFDVMQRRKYIQFDGPNNSASYETVNTDLLNGRVHFVQKTGNGFVMLPATADEDTVIRIVNNEDASIPSLGVNADDNDILVKYNDGTNDIEVAYIAPKDTMVFIYNSTQSPKWMVGVGI